MLCQFIHKGSFSCLRCWELSAGNIKWIYQAPILAAIGVSLKACIVKKKKTHTLTAAETQWSLSIISLYRSLGNSHFIAEAVGRVRFGEQTHIHGWHWAPEEITYPSFNQLACGDNSRTSEYPWTFACSGSWKVLQLFPLFIHYFISLLKYSDHLIVGPK